MLNEIHNKMAHEYYINRENNCNDSYKVSLEEVYFIKDGSPIN